jgi:capsular polysaccharide biosynthesis protein
MRDFIKSKISNRVLMVSSKKIYIKRNSHYRNVTNAEEVEEMLVAKGFVVVEPEKLSFIEQVELFSSAEVVVGATGASFANLIFCKPETKIIILISDYKNMIYGYWQNMASAVGNKVTYVIGASDEIFSHLHSNFQISIPDLLDAISD